MNTKPIRNLESALLLILIFILSFIPPVKAGACVDNCLRIYSITLTDLGTSIRASVKVVDEFMNSGASRSATVQGRWTRPDGSQIDQYANIGTRLRADLKFGTGGLPGTYIFEVVNVRKTGYTFDPTGGADPIASILIQDTGNQPPIAVINTDRTVGEAPLDIHFDALSSHDPDGVVASYLWNFGDGTTSYEPSLIHTYSVSGSYTATLDILDDMGARASSSVTIEVNDPAPAGCQSLCLSLDEFKMGFRRGMVIGSIRVMDENEETAYDVIVEGVWTLPDGSTVAQTNQNGDRKLTSFKIPANQPGTYTLSVTEVVKTGYQYAPEHNLADSGSYLVE